ncbi:hypothetical protein Cyast_1438 [Cyanobacterium stanieri PCC 7202]|uniref:Tetratricopeptide TPR_1 repeat-containing protein n=1 Tax=Cyanobacterium stanieri (strain ATCC 29140 / PCC 7202) TaxID=292563 RepID=K9YLP4_CYASC|nr:hypothetical protein Cyast_1438 [Cyanobacterium stanieri PCC 7202]
MRKLKKPKEVLKLTDDFLSKKIYADAQVKSAILTTRGGAFLDLEDFEKAKEYGHKALKLMKTHQAHSLLGNVYAKTGEYDKRDKHFKCASEIKKRIKRKKQKKHKKPNNQD